MPDYQYIISTGLVVADTSDTLDGVQQEWKDQFGQDLIVDPSTPQGVMIVSETTARESVASNNATLANQINPNEAGGVFLDAICALLGLERIPAQATRVPAVSLGGVAGTLIPAGTRARSQAGDVFATIGAVVLDSTGVATVDMVATVTGPIGCLAGELNVVLDLVLGWETVTNTLDGILGFDQQSDDSLRQLRRDTLARQGISTREAQLSGLNNLPGVTSAVFRENYTDAPVVTDGIPLDAHSVWACVDGGTDLDVARSLLNDKTDGAGWNGARSVVVVDPFSGQSYTVLFDRATLIPVFVRVTLQQGTSTADPTDVVPQAVVDYAAGKIPNEPGLTIGAAASPFEVAAGINYFYPGFRIKEVALALGTDTPTPVEIPISLLQRALIDASFVTVIVV